MSAISHDLGPCCICGQSDKPALNIIMIDRRSPHGMGWGCAQCGLPCEGASAIVCNKCFDLHCKRGLDLTLALKWYCIPDGNNYLGGRAPVTELDGQPVWKHDMSRHPEHNAAFQ